MMSWEEGGAYRGTGGHTCMCIPIGTDTQVNLYIYIYIYDVPKDKEEIDSGEDRRPPAFEH